MSGKKKPPFKLVRPGPPLTSRTLATLEEVLHTKFGFPALPDGYRAFLMRHNGGFVSPGYVDDGEREHQEEVVFKTPLVWARDQNRPVCPCLVMFFYAWVEPVMEGSPPEDLQFCELISSNAYSRFDFDVLPNRMMSIAKCSHPDAADMLCLDLRDEGYGAVYYHYDMWCHPGRFHGDYYDRREAEVLARFGPDDRSAADLDDVAAKNARLDDALKRVPFVKVADSFDEFLTSLQPVARSS